MSKVIGVRFEKGLHTPVSASAFLKRHPELQETDLFIESFQGKSFLRSVQHVHAGPTEVRTADAHPGVHVIFAKGFGEDEETAPAVPAAPVVPAAAAPAAPVAGKVPSVDEIVESALSDETVVVDDGDEQKAAVEVAPEAAAEAAVASRLPPGRQFFENMVKSISELQKMSEAALEGQEPMLYEKCKSAVDGLTGLIDVNKAMLKELYGDGLEVDEAAEPANDMEKRLLIKRFSGEAQLLPATTFKAIHAISRVEDDHEMRRQLGVLLKGVSTRLPNRRTKVEVTKSVVGEISESQRLLSRIGALSGAEVLRQVKM